MSPSLTLGSLFGHKAEQASGLQACTVQDCAAHPDDVFFIFLLLHHLCNQPSSISYTEYSRCLSKCSLTHSIPLGPKRWQSEWFLKQRHDPITLQFQFFMALTVCTGDSTQGPCFTHHICLPFIFSISYSAKHQVCPVSNKASYVYFIMVTAHFKWKLECPWTITHHSSCDGFKIYEQIHWHSSF